MWTQLPSVNPMPLSTKEAYIQALRNADWWHEYSDDHRVWQRGRAELLALRDAQERFDPSYQIWNTFAPEPLRITKRSA